MALINEYLLQKILCTFFICQLIHVYVHEKNGLTEIYKNLDKYRFENINLKIILFVFI